MVKKSSYGVVGAQWGDEGKGKIVDILTGELSKEGGGVISRFNGGANAGHTVEFIDDDGVKQKIVSHQLPQGLVYENNIGYTGSGAVILPSGLREEVEELKNRGFSVKDRYFINPFTSVTQPVHIILDGGNKSKSIGTTKKGIGPTYQDQKGRTFNLKFYDGIYNQSLARDLMLRNADDKGIDISEDEVKKTLDDLSFLKDHVTENKYFLNDMFLKGKTILFEGANGLLLDNNYGNGENVTSSSVRPSSIFTGSDIPKSYNSDVVGVAKFLQSKVGAGFFPSVLGGEQARKYYNDPENNWFTREEILARYPVDNINSEMSDFELGLSLGAHANEFGATTGRPRQVGVLDLVLLKDASRFGGVDALILNSLDMMKYFNNSRFGGIPIVTGYEFNGKTITEPPLGTHDLAKVKPIIKVLPGFDEDITGIKEYKDLPNQAQNLVNVVENYLKDTGIKVTAVGVGPRRDQLVF